MFSQVMLVFMDLVTYAKIKKLWFDSPWFVFVFIHQVITPVLQTMKKHWKTLKTLKTLKKQWTNNYHLSQCGGVSGHVECYGGATEGFDFSFFSLKIK